MNQHRSMVGIALLGLLLAAACSSPQQTSAVTKTEVEYSYTESPETATDLKAASQAVVFATPTGAAEVPLFVASDGSMAIMGATFVVQSVVKGSVGVGETLTVIRPTVPGTTDEDQPGFTHPLYMLSLKDTLGSYPVPAWYPVGGPSGRVPFDLSKHGTFIGVIDDPDDPIQTLFVGQTQNDANVTMTNA
ncbi:MAG TPA: hypothetical protein VF660_00195 [Actinomycetota bacterium]